MSEEAKTSELYAIEGAENYRGCLHIAEVGGVYWWAVQCDFETASEWDWKQIPPSLYRELRKIAKPVENTGETRDLIQFLANRPENNAEHERDKRD